MSKDKKAEGPFLVLSGPSGVGKTLFLERALKQYAQFQNCITYTTRKPRSNEKKGRHYYFISKEEFTDMRKKNRFVEWAEVHDEWYGTTYDEIHQLWKQNKIIIKDLDIQGAREIKKLYPQSVTIFIYPPSIEELKRRILDRGAGINNLETRLIAAKMEMAEGRKYDFKIINDDFEKAWKEFQKIVENIKVL